MNESRISATKVARLATVMLGLLVTLTSVQAFSAQPAKAVPVCWPYCEDEPEPTEELCPTVWTGSDRADEKSGSSCNDKLSARGGDDRLYGKEGNDQLSGGNGSDYIEGGSGDDTIDADGSDWSGNDTVHAGDGNDTIHALGDYHADVFNGGPGYDMVIYTCGGFPATNYKQDVYQDIEYVGVGPC